MDETSLNKHISAMLDAEFIAVDTETTGLHVKDGRDYCMGVSVAYRVGTFLLSAYFPFRHRDGNCDIAALDKLHTILARKPLVFHNLKFDLHSLKTLGIEPKGRLFDTMTIAHMVNEEWPSKGLDYLSKMILKDQKAKEQLEKWTDTFGWRDVPVDIIDEYARHDAELTLRLFEDLWPRMKEQELDGLWDTESDYVRLLAEIERRGVAVDLDFCRRQSERGAAIMDFIADELGFQPSRTTLLADYLLNELNLPVLKETPGGKPCFDKSVMEQYDELLAQRDDKGAQLVLTYRGWQKACSSLYDSILEKCSPDGRVRPNFKVHGTVTGRLSCSEPNLQQIPRGSDKPWNGTAKQAFRAKDGYTLWEFDYSQLEYRLAAAYGNEWDLINLFNEGADPFLPTAEQVFGGPEYRQSAKTLTYSTLYGAGVNRIKTALNLSEAEAESVRERFRELYPGIYKASSSASKLATKRGYVRYWTGRRRHFPFFNGERQGAHKSFNSVIQGGGAEVVKRAGLRVAAEVCNERCLPVLTVHDSWVYEIENGYEETVIPQIKKIMGDFPEFKVNLDVDHKKWGAK